VLRAAILLLEVVCLFVLVNQPVFASTQVEVSGAKHLSRQHILDRAGLSPGTSIFLVSTSAAQSELAGDPYVRSATVRTQLPNQVRIEVTEWEPLALVTRGNARYLLNEQGNVLTATTDVGLGRNPGQPRVPITEEDTAALAPGQSAINSRLVVDLDQMQSTFPSAYGLTVARFVIQSGGQLVVETTGGPRILFGQMVTPEQIDSLDAKLAALKSLSSQVDLGHSNLDYVTLENPNAPATHSIPSPSPSPKPSASPTKKP
jgi:cell division septal protein FtsQ